MKYFLFAATLLLHYACHAQNKLIPRFENDTVYTSYGFKIYKGQKLHFAKGTGKNGLFRYVRLAAGCEQDVLTDNTITVKSLKRFNISYLGTAYIFVSGNIVFKDGDKGEVRLNLAFDLAIQSFPGLLPEMIIPDN